MRRVLALLVGAALVLGAGCNALPRSGPLAAQIDAPEIDGALDGLVAPLTAETAAAARPAPPPGFPAAFVAAGDLDPDLIGVDDVVEVVVWEGAEGGLFSAAGGGVTLPTMRVDDRGMVFVPFAGELRAAGRTVAELRAGVRDALAALTLSPQISVRVLEVNSRAVTIQGAIGAPGAYPIHRATTRLLPLIAAAGGVSTPPALTQVVLRRDGVNGSESLARIYADPARDIALRPRDAILVQRSDASFSVLGASSIQSELAFPTEPLDLLTALGAANGLRDLDADPTAVFLFRREDAAVANALLAGPQPEGLPAGPGRPIVYRLDLTDPNAFFVARSFEMRDGDAIFVSNAPLTELRKFLQLFTAVLAPVQQTSTLQP